MALANAIAQENEGEKKNWNETDKNVLICTLYHYIIIFIENSREFRDKLSEEI